MENNKTGNQSENNQNLKEHIEYCLKSVIQILGKLLYTFANIHFCTI